MIYLTRNQSYIFLLVVVLYCTLLRTVASKRNTALVLSLSNPHRSIENRARVWFRNDQNRSQFHHHDEDTISLFQRVEPERAVGDGGAGGAICLLWRTALSG